MANLKQKNELAKLLKKLGDTSYPEHVVIDEIVKEVENIRQSIPKPTDLSPFYSTVGQLNERYDSLFASVSHVTKVLDSARKQFLEKVKSSDDSVEKFKNETLDVLNELENTLNLLSIEIKQKGGGSQHRKISIAGTIISNRYADINILSGATAADNNTTRQVDVTLNGGSSSTFQIPLSGIVDGVNTTFTWATAPNVIVRDGAPMKKTQTNGESNWTGTTTTGLTQAPNKDLFATN